MADESKPTFTLAELGEIDVTQVDELRFEVLPIMTALWEVKDCKKEVMGKDDKVAIVVVAKPYEIHQVLDEAYKTPEDQAKLLEKEHREAFFIKEREDVGRFKAFCVDTGQIEFPSKEDAQKSGTKITLDQLIDATKGLRFPGKIEHRPRKDDPSKVNANLRPIPPKKEAKK